MKTNIQIMDCTLRDGSYAVNFQFTSRDTSNICSKLEEAGINLIEIGHGLGLGIKSPHLGIPFENDIEYIRSAVSSVSHAKIGAFFIPKISSINILKKAKESGLKFIRIGVEALDIKSSERAIDYSLSLGLEVHLNLMKSYVINPNKLHLKLKNLKKYDLESVYIVDSAGCMLPADLHDYIKVVKNSGFNVGFHGHNNLEMANANCLEAINCGVKYIDSSLSGIGRSAGNAQTEILVYLMKKIGFDTKVDCYKLFDITEKYLKPLMVKKQGKSALEIVTGVSKFHTQFLPIFKKVTSKYDVNLYKLIEKVSNIDCTNPSDKLIDSIAKDMSRIDE